MGIFGFVLFILVALVALGGIIGLIAAERKAPAGITLGVAVVLAVILGFFTFTYTNGEGQAKVLKSITGEVVGYEASAGLKGKAPWQNIVNFDTRNQQVEFAGSKKNENLGQNGAQITIQDREGVSANIDVSVRYSIKPDAVVDIYKEYGSNENFVSRFIENDIRAGVRNVPANYGTLELLNNRGDVELKITEYLEKRWEKQGVQVETVSLQEIRYPQEVQERFAEAQNARTEVEKANAELEANKVKAESNRVLAESLTDTNLEQLKYETLREIGKKGNLIIVPENFSGMLNVPSPEQPVE